jgi:hypothetical protein
MDRLKVTSYCVKGKVKEADSSFVLYQIKHYAMKVYGEWGTDSIFLDLSASFRWEVSFNLMRV